MPFYSDDEDTFDLRSALAGYRLAQMKDAIRRQLSQRSVELCEMLFCFDPYATERRDGLWLLADLASAVTLDYLRSEQSDQVVRGAWIAAALNEDTNRTAFAVATQSQSFDMNFWEDVLRTVVSAAMVLYAPDVARQMRGLCIDKEAA